MIQSPTKATKPKQKNHGSLLGYHFTSWNQRDRAHSPGSQSLKNLSTSDPDGKYIPCPCPRLTVMRVRQTPHRLARVAMTHAVRKGGCGYRRHAFHGESGGGVPNPCEHRRLTFHREQAVTGVERAGTTIWGGRAFHGDRAVVDVPSMERAGAAIRGGGRWKSGCRGRGESRGRV